MCAALKIQFDPQSMEKPPSKVAHNRPRTFFLRIGLAAQTAQKQKSHTTKSPLIQDWVFRLGSKCKSASNLDGINLQDTKTYQIKDKTLMFMNIKTSFSNHNLFASGVFDALVAKKSRKIAGGLACL